MKKMIKDHIIWTTIITLIVSLLIIIGIIYFVRTKNLASWDAINSVGEWASVLVAILVPIAIIYIEEQIEKNTNELEKKKNEIKVSNTVLYDEIIKLKREINNGLDDFNNFTEHLKQDIYKYICISMLVTTKNIMDKFNLSLEESKNILLELSKYDNLIKIAYLDDDINNEDCHWQKRY